MKTRRAFLADVGRSALAVTLGFRAAADLGFAPALADADDDATPSARWSPWWDSCRTRPPTSCSRNSWNS